MVLCAQCPKRGTPSDGEQGVGSLWGQKQALSILRQMGQPWATMVSPGGPQVWNGIHVFWVLLTLPSLYSPICEMEETVPVSWAFSKIVWDGPILQQVLSS